MPRTRPTSKLLLAALALACLGAPAAQAEELRVHVSATPTTLSGEPGALNVFHFPGAGSAACNDADFTGTVSEATKTSLEVHPEYAECAAFGFGAEVLTTGCNYKFDELAGSGPYTAAFHIVCSGSNKIKVTPTFFGSSVCTIEIASQTPSGSADLENKESKSHLLVTSTATKISHTNGCGSEAASNAEYTGSVTTKGGANKLWVATKEAPPPEGKFHTAAAPTALSGSQVAASEVHFPGAGSWSCSGANFVGTVSATTSASFEVHPEYSGCSAFGFTTDISTTGCNYKFDELAGSGPYTAAFHIVCSGSNKIKITPTFFGSSVCTMEIGSQTPSGGVDIENKESESHILWTSTLAGISHTAGCGASAAADATYTGSVTEKGGTNKIWVT